MKSHVGINTTTNQLACSDPGANSRITIMCTVFLSHDVKAKPYYLSLKVSRQFSLDLLLLSLSFEIAYIEIQLAVDVRGLVIFAKSPW